MNAWVAEAVDAADLKSRVPVCARGCADVQVGATERVSDNFGVSVRALTSDSDAEVQQNWHQTGTKRHWHGGPKPKPVLDRILASVEMEPNSGCWLWLKRVNRSGYGLICVSDEMRPTHRMAYEATFGAVPAGLVLDHRCRVRSCCNPRHLEPVTSRENSLRGVGVSAINATKTVCKNGHAFDAANTRVNIDQRTQRERRVCRACNREGGRRRYAVRHAPTQSLPKVGGGR